MKTYESPEVRQLQSKIAAAPNLKQRRQMRLNLGLQGSGTPNTISQSNLNFPT